MTANEPVQPANDAKATPPPRVSRLALASLAVAAFSFGLWFIAGMSAPLPAALAVLLGYLGRRAVRRGAGRLTGRGFASWGLRLGVLHLALAGVYAVVVEPLAF